MIVAPGTIDLIRRISLRSKVRFSTTRCDVTVPLKRVRGAFAGAGFRGGAAERRWKSGIDRCMNSRNRCGWSALLIPARISSSCGVGNGSAGGSSPAGGRSASGDVSWMTDVSSAPDIPSIAAWCVLLSTANEPGGTPSTLSRPSMTYISHSGRSRSSSRACSRAAWMHSWRQSPGFGRAMWRMWNSRSNSGSVTHHGWSRSNGTRTIRSR